MPSPALKASPSGDERVVMIVATLVCALTALVVTSLRVFIRATIIRNFGWDVGWRPTLPIHRRAKVI